MVLVLHRTYSPEGTNGTLTHNGHFICHTIELPWQFNRSQVSCIPEGEYFLSKRYSKRFGWHFEVLDVPNRSFILIHPANDALQELSGCIAPVLQLTGAGKGQQSRLACAALLGLLFPLLDQQESLLLLVQSGSVMEP